MQTSDYLTRTQQDDDTLGTAKLIATATVGDEGWVDLPKPTAWRAGSVFAAVPEEDSPCS